MMAFLAVKERTGSRSRPGTSPLKKLVMGTEAIMPYKIRGKLGGKKTGLPDVVSRPSENTHHTEPS